MKIRRMIEIDNFWSRPKKAKFKPEHLWKWIVEKKQSKIPVVWWHLSGEAEKYYRGGRTCVKIDK